MNINLTTLLLSICLFLGGCSFHDDVSHLKPFSKYSDSEVTLQRPACLIEEWAQPSGEILLFHLNDDMTYSGFFMFDSKQTQSDKVIKKATYSGSNIYLTPIETIKSYTKYYRLWDQQKKCGLTFLIYQGDHAFGTNTAKFWTLPAGTRFWLNKVSVSGNPFSGSFTDAEGRLQLPDSKEEITFSYNWAAGFNLSRAPWEDENTPDQRFIGYKGNEYHSKDNGVKKDKHSNPN